MPAPLALWRARLPRRQLREPLSSKTSIHQLSNVAMVQTILSQSKREAAQWHPAANASARYPITEAIRTAEFLWVARDRGSCHGQAQIMRKTRKGRRWTECF